MSESEAAEAGAAWLAEYSARRAQSAEQRRTARLVAMARLKRRRQHGLRQRYAEKLARQHDDGRA